MQPATVVVCAGCGHRAPDDDPYPFRCPRAGSDDIDHVMVRELDPDRVSFPDEPDEPNPFVRYRELFHAYHLGRRHGLSDADHVALVREMDERVAEVEGHGFTVTPFAPSDVLSERLGAHLTLRRAFGLARSTTVMRKLRPERCVRRIQLKWIVEQGDGALIDSLRFAPTPRHHPKCVGPVPDHRRIQWR